MGYATGGIAYRNNNTRMNELLDVQLSKSELVRRARALNQLAIGYRLSSSQREQAWSDDVRKRRDELMLRARAI